MLYIPGLESVLQCGLAFGSKGSTSSCAIAMVTPTAWARTSRRPRAVFMPGGWYGPKNDFFGAIKNRRSVHMFVLGN